MSASEWKPTASVAALRLRAILLGRIRAFFDSRGILEVETPLLGRATATDPHIESLQCSGLYLQTSPELAMKRLLASGFGPIFQIAKAFRAGESGARHNTEFTLVEWYRPGFDHHALMEEMDLFLQEILGTDLAERETYEDLFERHIALNPHGADSVALARAAAALGEPPVAGSDLLAADWLNLLFAQVIEPKLGVRAPVFVYDYPVGLAALARIRPGNPPVAERFEVYYRGMELANGYHELTDAREQRERFRTDLERRRALGREAVPADERLLAALEAGLPVSSGVALGLDRLLMIAAGTRSIRDVLSFPFDIS